MSGFEIIKIDNDHGDSAAVAAGFRVASEYEGGTEYSSLLLRFRAFAPVDYMDREGKSRKMVEFEFEGPHHMLEIEVTVLRIRKFSETYLGILDDESLPLIERHQKAMELPFSETYDINFEPVSAIVYRKILGERVVLTEATFDKSTGLIFWSSLPVIS